MTNFTAAATAALSTADMVHLHNELSVNAVKKFTNRDTAIRRVSKLLEDLGLVFVEADGEADHATVEITSPKTGAVLGYLRPAVDEIAEADVDLVEVSRADKIAALDALLAADFTDDEGVLQVDRVYAHSAVLGHYVRLSNVYAPAVARGKLGHGGDSQRLAWLGRMYNLTSVRAMRVEDAQIGVPGGWLERLASTVIDEAHAAVIGE